MEMRHSTDDLWLVIFIFVDSLWRFKGYSQTILSGKSFPGVIQIRMGLHRQRLSSRQDLK